MEQQKERASITNINMGVLGHVDSGKTSLCRILSEIKSTASLDKSRQSQERGITLDLGFSCLYLNRKEGEGQLQVTLVDCPGHASLIKTVIGGAQIIDCVLLVVDVLKGIQQQTAECLIIAQILKRQLFVVFNKVDLIKDESQIETMVKKTCLQLNKLGLVYDYALVSCNSLKGIEELKELLVARMPEPKREVVENKSFSVLVDHCFSLSGKGVVLTGTVLSGKVKVGDMIELPSLSGSEMYKKVQNIQMFRQNIKEAMQGDRIAILMKAFDSSGIERCIVSSKGLYQGYSQAVFTFSSILFYKPPLHSKLKLHITSGHQTIMGLIYIITSSHPVFSLEHEYQYADTYIPNQDKVYHYMVIHFEQPMLLTQGSLIIASNLNNNNNKSCRLAFHGQFIQPIKLTDQLLKVVRHKRKEGKVDKVIDQHTLLVVGLFKKQTNIQLYIGYKVELPGGEGEGEGEEVVRKGKVLSSFGNSGKVKVQMDLPIPSHQQSYLKDKPVFMLFQKQLLNKKINR